MENSWVIILKDKNGKHHNLPEFDKRVLFSVKYNYYKDTVEGLSKISTNKVLIGKLTSITIDKEGEHLQYYFEGVSKHSIDVVEVSWMDLPEVSE